MLNRDDIRALLQIQQDAYQLLMWLADEANRDPYLLAPEAAAALREPETAAAWLERNRARLPAALLPTPITGAFSNLLASFFSTSFRVRHLEFEGRLVESRVTQGAEPDPEARAGLEQCQALALRHLAAAEQLPITDRDARRLVGRKSLREASLLWSYAWELDRRAKGKGKGSVVHRIWRELPRETRKALTCDAVWSARQQLLTAVRELRDREGA